MSAKLRLPGGTILSIAGFEWSCAEDPGLAASLNSSKRFAADCVDLLRSKDPDIDEAERVQRLMGGEIFEHTQFGTRADGRTD